MIGRDELSAYLDELLQPSAFSDYCPNGLQVEGRGEVGTLVSGVTASQAMIEAARENDADALLVHHGYFWRNEDAKVTGMKARRLRALLASDINLFAYHLPLDAHEQFGNNVQLAGRLDLEVTGLLEPGAPETGRVGRLKEPQSAAEFTARLEAQLQHPVVWAGPETKDPIATVGWCTGAGQQFIEQAARLGLDAFVSGEISEQTVHTARECGVHYFACGHHATERYGVQAVGRHLEEKFGLRHQFIDIPNPA